ncbi:MAG: TRAP-type transport system periplasmic protein [Acetobacteraceae bacterium]|nr:TRAP-type transport system periplasmic protein [Acetobacteraceae bacterium]
MTGLTGEAGENCMPMRRLAILAASALLLAAAPALAQDKPGLAQDRTVTLKMSSWVPPAHPLNPSLIAWAADIEKESGGTIKAVLFPSEQLGKAFDHYDMARDGITDLAYVNPGYQPGRFPIVAAGELPFLIGNARGGSAAFDEWYRPHAAKEMKDTHFCFAFLLDPQGFHSRHKILLPEDLKGDKVRPGDATQGAFVTLLGGTNVQASAPEAREVLERGVANTIIFPWGSISLFGIDKVLKYDMDEPMFSTTFVWVMNQAKYDALSAAQRTVIDHHCTPEWAEKVATPFADFEHAGHAKLAAASGHEIYRLTPEQLAAWHKAATPLTAKWAAKVDNADAVLADLKAALQLHGALSE